MSLSATVRHRLEAQGFACDVAGFEQLEPWLRFSPALCTILIAIATALALPPLLWAIVGVAAIGAVFPVHPFDLLYTVSVRSLARTPALPRKRLSPSLRLRRRECMPGWGGAFVPGWLGLARLRRGSILGRRRAGCHDDPLLCAVDPVPGHPRTAAKGTRAGEVRIRIQ